MPNTIEVLANEKTTLDFTLQRALSLLRTGGINVISAAHIIGNETEAPTGRILLQNNADRLRALGILAGGHFKAF